MSQSNVIAGFLALAFIVFITVRGELPVYLGLLLADPANGSIKPAATAASVSSSDKLAAVNKSNADNLASAAKSLALFV